MNFDLLQKNWINDIHPFYTILIFIVITLIIGCSTSNNEPNIWLQETPLPNETVYHASVLVQNKIYIAGGLDSSLKPSATVYVAEITSTLDTNSNEKKILPLKWKPCQSLPAPRYLHQMVYHEPYLYILGGVAGENNILHTVYYAEVHEDGSLSNWRMGSRMPKASAGHDAFVYKDRLYYINAIAFKEKQLPYQDRSIVYVAGFKADGGLDIWQLHEPLESRITNHAGVQYKDSYFVFGGEQHSEEALLAGKKKGVFPSGVPLATIYKANFNEAGYLEGWKLVGKLPEPMKYSTGWSYDNHIYLCGGENDSLLDACYIASLENETLEKWNSLENLPFPLKGHTSHVYNDRLYMLGGMSDETVQSSVISIKMKEGGFAYEP